MNKLERLTDSLPSLGADAPTLLSFKQHAALAEATSWTAMDPTLSAYLDAAEFQVDELCASPYRPRSYTYTFQNFDRLRLPFRPIIQSCSSYYSLKVPLRPVIGNPTIAWIADDGTTGTWTCGTDFSITGRTSIDPEIWFPHSFVLPVSNNTPYPYTMSFQAGGGIEASIKKLCIFEYACGYHRNPEAVGDKLSYVSQVFDANMTFLQSNFL